jgi:hypothetical protein
MVLVFTLLVAQPASMITLRTSARGNFMDAPQAALETIMLYAVIIDQGLQGQ